MQVNNVSVSNNDNDIALINNRPSALTSGRQRTAVCYGNGYLHRISVGELLHKREVNELRLLSVGCVQEHRKALIRNLKLLCERLLVNSYTTPQPKFLQVKSNQLHLYSPKATNFPQRLKLIFKHYLKTFFDCSFKTKNDEL